MHGKVTREMHDLAFRSWLRRGADIAEGNDDMRSALEGIADKSTPTGGIVAPEDFATAIAVGQAKYDFVRRAPVTILQTPGTTDNVRFPVDDPANDVGEMLDLNNLTGTINPEGEVGPDDTTTFSRFLFSSRVIRIHLNNMGGFVGFENYLATRIAKRLARAQCPIFTNGTGAGTLPDAVDPGQSISQPMGIVTGSGAGVVAASATTFTYAELLALVNSVDEYYRLLPSAGFMLTEKTLQHVKTLQDANGNPVWHPAYYGGGATILGYPYWLNSSMPAMTATKKPIVFGAMEYFVIRDAIGATLNRLNERFARYFEVGFLATRWSDSKHTNSAALKTLQMHA